MGETRILPLVLCIMALAAFGHVTQGEEYIVACHQYCSIDSYSDETGSWVQINRTLAPFHDHRSYPESTGVENKSFLVKTSDNGVFPFLVNSHGSTSLLPISGLGTMYIVSYCHPPGNFSSVLVIATHSEETDVSITFRLQGNVTYDNNTHTDGDELTVSLEEYQTLTIRSDFDLTGTVVNTTQTVALFIRVIYNNYYDVRACEQLLPVHLYGQEHIVAVPPVSDPSDVYWLQIISEHSDTQIVFNNGFVFSVDENHLYRQYLTPDTNIQFSSSKPVMALLCQNPFTGHWFIDFVVIPPLTLYIKHAVIYSSMLTVVTKHSFADLVVQNISVSDVPGEWEEIPGTDYTVGTWTGIYGVLSISSNSSFSVLVSYGSLHNGGYGVSSSESNTDEALTLKVLSTKENSEYFTVKHQNENVHIESSFILKPVTELKELLAYYDDRLQIV